MRCVAFALLALCISAAVAADTSEGAKMTAVQGTVKHSVVIVHEPKLSTELSDVIHPYAFSGSMPDPHYDASINAYNVASHSDLGSFVEVRTHMKASSSAAAKLQAATVLKESFPKLKLKLKFGGGKRGKGRKGGKGGKAGARGGGGGGGGGFPYNRRGFSTVMKRPLAHNPASPRLPFKLKHVPSDFPTVDRTHAYRRAQYGFRRRRMPYFASHNPYNSVNPFHRPNPFVATPNDFFALRPVDPMKAVMDPKLVDLGRFRRRETLLPYGGYSSFGDSGSSSSSESSSGSSGGGGPRLGALRGGGRFKPPSFPKFNTHAWSDGLSDPSLGGLRSNVGQQGGGDWFGLPYTSPVSPYIPGGDYSFYDFYGSGVGGGSAGGDSAGSSE